MYRLIVLTCHGGQNHPSRRDGHR
ncbi:uncharacterized protein METZ01_LOCUS127088 [marine metagenome]|uniref:Uncharacterized protein n=1 Tax=marine metagenome TaxID=408172 RepID=A0A381YB60_9ZZZZ